MNEYWLAAATLIVGFLTRYIRPRGTRELALVDQLQEENKELRGRVDALERRAGVATRRELRMYKYIIDIHRAAAAGETLPPIPDDLFGAMFEET